MTLPIGLVRGMPADEYHADPSVSNTMLSAMNKSPAHCWALHLDPNRSSQEPTPAMLAGTMTHAAILEPAAFDARYIVKPEGCDYRTKDGREWRDKQTRQIITTDDLTRVRAQREAVLKVTVLRNLLSQGEAEASVFWTDTATGLRCRARPDWLHMTGTKRCIAVDLKTISDLTLESAMRSIASYGYHRQAAHYVDGLRAAGYEVEDFVFAFVSSSYPFIAAAYVLDDETMSQGADEVAELRDRFAECKKRGEWPAFGEWLQLISLPTWAKRSSEVEVSYVE